MQKLLLDLHLEHAFNQSEMVFGRRVSLLDGHIDWYRKRSYATSLDSDLWSHAHSRMTCMQA